MNPNDQIVPDLTNLQLEDIEQLDREVTDSQAFEYYESIQIMRANVYRDTLSGRVGDFAEGFEVQVSVLGKEISGSCSCSQSRIICRHVIALLYGWVLDGSDFINIGEKIAEISELEPARLVEIISNILRHNPSMADLFLQRDRSNWDDLDFDSTSEFN